MNKPFKPADLTAPTVTTGPLPASTKVYISADLETELRVPFREIGLHPSAGEPPLRVYDTSGPFTDPTVSIDVEQGLARPRTDWVLERGGVRAYDGRQVKPEDNGSVSSKHLARYFPVTHRPLVGDGSRPLTGSSGRCVAPRPEMNALPATRVSTRMAAIRRPTIWPRCTRTSPSCWANWDPSCHHSAVAPVV